MGIRNRTLAILTLTNLPLLAQPQEVQAPSPQPVLIELFTSQGCSSCPPAEDLLNTWGLRLFREGKALPLAFHVDYWDSLGWRDPFSSSNSTVRQRKYAWFFRDRSIYTPEMVVDGGHGFVGSNGNLADSETVAALKKRKPFAFDIAAKLQGRTLTLDIGVRPMDEGKDLSGTTIWIALFENGLETSVEKGENEGKNLRENFVVRSFSDITPAERVNNGIFRKVIPLDAGWKSSKMGAAVFAQDQRTMGINGVAWTYPLVKDQ